MSVREAMYPCTNYDVRVDVRVVFRNRVSLNRSAHEHDFFGKRGTVSVVIY